VSEPVGALVSPSVCCQGASQPGPRTSNRSPFKPVRGFALSRVFCCAGLADRGGRWRWVILHRRRVTDTTRLKLLVELVTLQFQRPIGRTFDAFSIGSRWLLIMKPVRRFNLVDAAVLIAATATAFAFVQFQQLPLILAEKWFPPKDNILRPPEDGDLATLVSSFLIPWTLALLALCLRPPRPSRRRLIAQPGFAACGMATVMMILICLNEYRLNIRVYDSYRVFGVQTLVALNYRVAISFAVAGVWALMAACGSWRAEPTWIDRAGRLVGTLWIVLIYFR
jgi:hypothetical protein